MRRGGSCQPGLVLGSSAEERPASVYRQREQDGGVGGISLGLHDSGAPSFQFRVVSPGQHAQHSSGVIQLGFSTPDRLLSGSCPKAEGMAAVMASAAFRHRLPDLRATDNSNTNGLILSTYGFAGMSFAHQSRKPHNSLVGLLPPVQSQVEHTDVDT